MANYSTPAQNRVAQYLASVGGEIEDESGLASRRLADAVQSNPKALAGVLRDMEDKGLIERLVQGRRTFIIRLLRSVDVPEPPPPSEDGALDYARLADHLLTRCAEVLSSRGSDQQDKKQIGHLQGVLHQERERREAAEERTSVLARQLERAQDNNSVLTERVSTLETEIRQLRSRLRDTPRTTNGGFKVAELLDEESRHALKRLMEETPRS